MAGTSPARVHGQAPRLESADNVTLSLQQLRSLIIYLSTEAMLLKVPAAPHDSNRNIAVAYNFRSLL